MDVRVLVAFCIHGKARAMMTEPNSSAIDHRSSPEFKRDFENFRSEIEDSRLQTASVSAEDARKCDIHCAFC